MPVVVHNVQLGQRELLLKLSAAKELVKYLSPLATTLQVTMYEQKNGKLLSSSAVEVTSREERADELHLPRGPPNRGAYNTDR